MKTYTIYYDKDNHIHHRLICEVSEENGSHAVISSDIYDNMLSATWTHTEAQKRFGAANVRFYLITEVK